MEGEWKLTLTAFPFESPVQMERIAKRIAVWVTHGSEPRGGTGTGVSEILEGSQMVVSALAYGVYMIEFDFQINIPLASALQQCGNLALNSLHDVLEIHVGLPVGKKILLHVNYES